MNVNENSPRTDSRLQRIKKTSRVLQSVFLLYFGLFPLVLLAEHFRELEGFGTLRAIPVGLKIYAGLCAIIYMLAGMTFSRLLELYEKGIFYAAQNILQIRRLGKLAIYYGLVCGWRTLMDNHTVEFPVLLPLNILLSPWLILGGVILIIAWVTDEGRKIQEEQQLTV
jgi:hypothetical protein